jgi:hypothetical protein
MLPSIRVTRFGEFWAIGRLLTLGRFSKITEVASAVGLPFTYVVKFYELILTKFGLGCVLGEFITNSSGRPVVDPQRVHYLCFFAFGAGFTG